MKKAILCLLIMMAFLFVSEIQAKTLGIQSASGAPGDLVTVAVTIDDAKDLLSADVTLAYDQTLLTLQEVRTATLTPNFIIAYKAGTGGVSIAIATAQALQGGIGSLLEASFQIASTATAGTEISIQISKATLYSGTYQSMDKTLQGGKVVIGSSETVTTPATPKGPASGTTGTSYSYSTSGSTSSSGHTVEFQFDWKGDGSDPSAWGSGTQSKIWTVAGTYNVKTRARCKADTQTVSAWSAGLSVTISNNTNVPIISVTPTAKDYGNVKVNKSKTVSFKVTNSGKADLSILASAITGTDASMFTITSGNGSHTIKPKKNLTIKVALKPTSRGAKSATLEITSNDPVTPTVDITLSGTGQ